MPDDNTPEDYLEKPPPWFRSQALEPTPKRRRQYTRRARRVAPSPAQGYTKDMDHARSTHPPGRATAPGADAENLNPAALELLAAIEEHGGNLRQTAITLGVHQVTISNRVKRLGLREHVRRIAAERGWDRRGRQPKPRTGKMDPAKIVPLVAVRGVTEAARVTGMSPRTLHRICLEAGHDMRGRSSRPVRRGDKDEK